MDAYGAQPGQDFPPPGQPGAAGAELRLSLDGRDIALHPGQQARVGRSPECDLVTEAPTVSRHHAVLRWGNAGWEFETTGSAPTYLNGQQVTRLVVDRPLMLVLGSADGPVLRADPVPPPGSPGPGAVPGMAGAPGHGEPGHGAPGNGAASPGYGAAGPGYGAGAAGFRAAAPGYGAGYGAGAPPGGGAPGWAQPPAPPGWGAPPGRHQMPPGGYPEPGPHGSDEMAALRILFPIQSWVHNSGWRQGLRLLVIAYALLPLIFLAVLSSSNDLSAPGWAYSLYIAPLWITGFWLLIRPGHLVRAEVEAAVGIVAWTFIWINVVTINVNDSLHISGNIAFIPALVIGFNEEITKALPVLLAGVFLLQFRKVKLSVRMSMFLGTIAGLTFGIAEQAFYTSNDIIGINQAQSNNEAVNAALAFAERIFVDGFQHAVWAGIAGFFIGLSLNYPRRRIQLIVLGVAVPALLHALNDFLAGSSVWLVILVQAASLLLFLGYTMSEASIEQQVKDSPLFRGDSLVIQAFRDPAQPPGRGR